MSKYHNVKTVFQSIKFDSKAEARRFQELTLLQKAGEINNLKCQPSFILLDPFTHKQHGKIRGVTYRADFSYADKEGKDHVEDVKGGRFRVPLYLLKRKLFLLKYPDIIFDEISYAKK